MPYLPPFPRKTCIVLLLLTSVTRLSAQTAPAPAQEGKSDDKEIVTLSPFTITEDSDVGYVATSSLAGSRLRTDLKNIASQIDVMTTEFLDDIAATNITDAVEYSTSTGGPNQQNAGPNSSSDDVKGEGRARGFDAVTVSSDFFATNLPSDFYNIERFTIANGPQSILFGLGNAGGVLDVSTKQARFNNAYSLEYRGDSDGSSRVVLDANHVVKPDTLAVRIAALHDREDQFISGGYNNSDRLFGTVTWRPLSNTTIRVSGEKADIKISNATNFISQDFVSPWVAAGRPLFDNSRGNTAINNASNPLYSRNTNGLRTVSYDPTGVTNVLVWNGSAITKGPHQVAGAEDNRDRSLLDGSIYPLDADPRVASRLNDIDGDLLRVFVEQKITDNLYVELGANRETRHEFAGGVFNSADSINIRGDANMYLPGGTNATPQTALNPNAGKLYIESNPNGLERRDVTEELRLSVSYEFDFAKRTEGFLSYFGRHRLIGLVSHRTDENLEQTDRATVVGNTSFTSGDMLNNSRSIRSRYYLDPASGNLTAGTLQNTLTGPWTFQDGATGQSFEARLFDHPAGRTGLTTGSRGEVDTLMFALQSDFWNERIQLFYGYREDSLKNFGVSDASNTRQDFNAAGDQLGLYRPLSQAGFASTPQVDDVGRSHSYGSVVRPMPWLSVFYSQSENYALPPGFRDTDDQPLPGTFSDGRDYGFRVDLWDNKFSMRVNFYEETQNANFSGLIQPLRDYAAAVEMRLRGPDAPAGIGPVTADGFDPVARGVDAYRATEHKAAEGVDVTLFARPLPNWDIRLAGGRQQTFVSGKAENFAQWIEQRLPVWQNAGGLGWQNVTISSLDPQTIQQYYNTIIEPEITSNRVRNNLLRFRQREWRASFFTNYQFEEGMLDGFNFGGGVRWLSKAVIGFAQQTLPNGQVSDDVSKPYYNDPLFYMDLVAGYERALPSLGKNTRISFQLNVRNLFDDETFENIRSSRDSTGSLLDAARNAGREIIFSTRLSF